MTWLDDLLGSAAARFSSMLSWWQWAILAAVPPAIVLLYFLKLKRRPVEVPSTFLWLKSIEDLHVNSIWQRLRNNLLLYLQLLLILLAAFALLRPSFEGRKLLGKRSIFLVDASASMQARDLGDSRLEEAKRRVGELIDEMQSGDVAMIVSFSDAAQVEQPFTDDRRRLRQALQAIEPTERPTSLVEALRVAAGLANPGRSSDKDNPQDVKVSEARPADVYIFSDGRFGPVAGFTLGNLKPVFVPIGKQGVNNLGIVALSVDRGDSASGSVQIFGRVQNFGDSTAKASVELYLNDQLVDADRLEIPAGESRGIAFDRSETQSGVLRLKLASKDDLALDNEAWAVIQPPRQANVLVVTPGNTPLELAMRTKLISDVARVRIEAPEFLDTEKYKQLAAGGLDLAVFDRCKPKKMPPCNTFFIGELPPDGGWKTKGATEMPPRIVDLDTSHPLLRWLDLGDVIIYSANPALAPAGGRTLIDSDQGPLLSIAPRDMFEDVALSFPLIEGRDKLNTNWHVSMSFPAFVYNLCDYLGGGRRARALESIRPGQAVPLEGAAGKEVLSIRSPDGRSTNVATGPTGQATYAGATRQGVYDVLSGGKPVNRFAVNLLDSQESQIAVDENPSLQIGYVEVAGQREWHVARKDLWKVALVLGLCVLGLEWYIYNRRVFV